jgi:hypothetical protein
MRCWSVIDRLTLPPTRLLKASSKNTTMPTTTGTSWACARVRTLVTAQEANASRPPET